MKVAFMSFARIRTIVFVWAILFSVYSSAQKVKQRPVAPPNKQLASSNVACKELPFPLNTHTKWLIAENAMNGLSNQLFGIYSYVPVAILWNVSLVVGEVFTRTSFEDEVKKYEGWLSVPFSSFFDWQHFSDTWARRGIASVEIGAFNNSCTAQRIPTRVVTREPHFWPNKDLIINRMLEKSSIPIPVPQNTILQFDPVYPKLTAMYNFWKGGLRNKLLLLQVHRSIRPAPHLQRIIDAILATLPGVFYVAHVRLEGDYLLHEHVSFDKEATQAMSAIDTHPCLKAHARTPSSKFMSPPGLYLASGLFNSTLYSDATGKNANSTSVQKVRAEKVLHKLRDMGFSTIYTRELALQRVIANLTSIISGATSGTTGGLRAPGINTDSGNGNRNINNIQSVSAVDIVHAQQMLRDIATLVPEQGALIDLMVSRACTCFVSSHYSSSFSYMAQRMRYMDNSQVLRYPDITEENFGKSEYFKQWGV